MMILDKYKIFVDVLLLNFVPQSLEKTRIKNHIIKLIDNIQLF